MGAFDLIRCESALFVMGFRRGLAACFDLLAPGGLLAVSEMCWLRPNPPAECMDYFAGVYPDISAAAGSVATMRELGYRTVDHFTLAESAW